MQPNLWCNYNLISDDKLNLISDGNYTYNLTSDHRSEQVRQGAEDLGITLERLPAYSPDFMPVEHLWQWLREEVTYHACYDHEIKLIAQVQAFEQFVNAKPTAVADRLWVKTTVNPDEEKLRVSG